MMKMRSLVFSIMLALTLAIAGVSNAQTVRYVDGSASTNGNGTGWNDPFNNLPAALLAASTTSDPQDEIWVKAGTYTPGSASATFQLQPNVAVYGGFFGNETSRRRMPLR